MTLQCTSFAPLPPSILIPRRRHSHSRVTRWLSCGGVFAARRYHNILKLSPLLSPHASPPFPLCLAICRVFTERCGLSATFCSFRFIDHSFFSLRWDVTMNLVPKIENDPFLFTNSRFDSHFIVRITELSLLGDAFFTSPSHEKESALLPVKATTLPYCSRFKHVEGICSYLRHRNRRQSCV